MGNMKDIGLLDCEDRPSTEENFKRVLKRVQAGGGGDILDSNGKLKSEVLPDGYPYEGVSNVTYDNNAYQKGDEIIGGGLFKVSDDTPAYNELLGGKIILPDGELIMDESILQYVEGERTMLGSFGIVTYSDHFETFGITFPTAGVYMVIPSEISAVISYSKNVVETIDPEFLPKGYPYKEKKGSKSIEFTPDEENYGFAVLEDFPYFTFGDIVELKVDGVEYSLIARAGDNGSPAPGVPAVWGDDWFVHNDGPNVVLKAYKPLVVSWDVIETVPMAYEFLGMLPVAIVYDGSKYTCNKTYWEVKKAIDDNTPIFAMYSNRSDTSHSTAQYIYDEVQYFANTGSISFRGDDSNKELAFYPDNTISRPLPV